MATTTAPARTAAQAATQLLAQNTAKGHKARASLIYDMHSQLYPHLYNSGKPKLSKLPAKKQNGLIRRSLPETAPFFASKSQWKKAYSDEKLEAARTSSRIPKPSICLNTTPSRFKPS
jgi:hypothetical protein